MAGILANSASKTMLVGDTAASNAATGFVTYEQVTLSVTPSGTTYSWSQAVPVGSATVKSALSATNAATCVFRPDVTGEYTVTCLVDGATLYVLRCSVIALVPTSFAGAMHFLAVPDAAVPVPATGKTQYLSADTGQMSFKLPNGTIERVTVT